MRKETENERTILPGQSQGVKKHNRRAKALLEKSGTARPVVRPTPPVVPS
jgi:hypothetical protein